MILAASDASHENVELLVAPEGAVVGERVRFGESDEPQAEPQTPNQIQKKKTWEELQPLLVTNRRLRGDVRGRADDDVRRSGEVRHHEGRHHRVISRAPRRARSTRTIHPLIFIHAIY